MNCRHCQTKSENLFLDLGFAPASNNYLTKDKLNSPETYFPLRLFVCDNCKLVQTQDFNAAGELFSDDYAYFSSASKSWLKHAKDYSKEIIDRLELDTTSFVIEIASNDGYLLKNFVEANIPCLGIEPTKSTADAAEKLNIPVLKEFFGVKTATDLKKIDKNADLIIGNNVYAHVPDINDFTKGLSIILKQQGTITLEFPHLLQLMEKNQFDTVYHEHFSYLSLFTVQKIFKNAGLIVYDVEEIKTHGGSLRIFGCHEGVKKIEINVDLILKKEKIFGLFEKEVYAEFQSKTNKMKNDFIVYLIVQKNSGKKIAAYGAAAKGNTLLNYAGIKHDLIDFVCDFSPSKQDKFLPGSHIPILNPDAIKQYKPDIVVIFPWNIKNEITEQLNFIREWGGVFVTAVPKLEIF